MSQAINPGPPVRPDWKHAAADFISARLELFGLEAGDALKTGVRKAVCAVIAAACAIFVWVALMTGLIGWIADASGMEWYFVTLLAALLHAIVAAVAVVIILRPVAPVFPLTKNELSKDREWLRTLKNRPGL